MRWNLNGSAITISSGGVAGLSECLRVPRVALGKGVGSKAMRARPKSTSRHGGQAVRNSRVIGFPGSSTPATTNHFSPAFVPRPRDYGVAGRSPITWESGSRMRRWANPRCWSASGRRSRPWRRRNGRGWRRRRAWRRRWADSWRWCRSYSTAARRLNFNRHRRAVLKEAYCRVGSPWGLIGIETEVIQCAPANRIGVLILRKGFCVPCDGGIAGLVIIAPGCAAESSISQRAIVGPARVLRRGVEPDIG
jgi:hypothetical protein